MKGVKHEQMPVLLSHKPALEHSTSPCAVSVAYALSAHANPFEQVPVCMFWFLTNVLVFDSRQHHRTQHGELISCEAPSARQFVATDHFSLYFFLSVFDAGKATVNVAWA